jgi:hypothetical protein
MKADHLSNLQSPISNLQSPFSILHLAAADEKRKADRQRMRQRMSGSTDTVTDERMKADRLSNLQSSIFNLRNCSGMPAACACIG